MAQDPKNPGSGDNSKDGEKKMLARQQEVNDHVGRLLEGLDATVINSNDETMQDLRRRFTVRRALANLSRFPEGFVFAWEVGRRRHDVILLTPPHQIAVQRPDGTWFRRARDVAEDGPMPYDLPWYRNYLRHQDLPSWFLRPAHIAMLDNADEAEQLGMVDSLASLGQPPRNYLLQRYDERPQTLVPEVAQTYSATLDASLVQRLARRFPALVANATTFRSYTVYVLPSGHITIRYQHDATAEVEPSVPLNQLQWIPETISTYLASYRIRDRRVGVSVAARRDVAQVRAIAEDDGGLVDMAEQPNGVGRWAWLTPDIDTEIAATHGLNTPQEVMQARRDGVFDNLPLNFRPLTVWYPAPRYLNPQTQPEGNGHWAYMTRAAEELAWTNFGGQHWFPNNARPSAAQTWFLRQSFWLDIANGTANEDITESVDLVWCPDSPASSPEPSIESSEPESNAGMNPDIFDLDSGLEHDPRNRGENDQTGEPGERKYQTIQINGKSYTVDRSCAHVNKRQDWKSWCINKHGKWYQWHRYPDFDWTSKAAVDQLNKWREQVLQRAGYPCKRKQARPDYTTRERDWLFEYVKESKGKRPTVSIPELTRRFNDQFDYPRDDLGIQSVIHRLREEFKKYKGQQKPRRKRGSKLPEKPAETDSEDDDNDGDDNDDEGSDDDGSDDDGSDDDGSDDEGSDGE